MCAGNIRTDKSQETQTPPNKDDKNSEVAQLLQRLQDAHAQAMQESRRITELEDQLQSMVQQNQELESQIMGIQQKGCEMKSMHEEFSLLEEVRLEHNQISVWDYKVLMYFCGFIDKDKYAANVGWWIQPTTCRRACAMTARTM